MASARRTAPATAAAGNRRRPDPGNRPKPVGQVHRGQHRGQRDRIESGARPRRLARRPARERRPQAAHPEPREPPQRGRRTRRTDRPGDGGREQVGGAHRVRVPAEGRPCAGRSASTGRARAPKRVARDVPGRHPRQAHVPAALRRAPVGELGVLVDGEASSQPPAVARTSRRHMPVNPCRPRPLRHCRRAGNPRRRRRAACSAPAPPAATPATCRAPAAGRRPTRRRPPAAAVRGPPAGSRPGTPCARPCAPRTRRGRRRGPR